MAHLIDYAPVAQLPKPSNVGIKGIEVYFPSRYVDQADLEKHDGISAGKYTIGLGQKRMSFCDDREDIYSFGLTVVSSLMAKYEIKPESIGRLEVGTETLLDKSKSVKSVLMQLFEESGNSDVEGIDTINACYGGTNAFFNAIQWIESSHWDGRDAIVVAGDIAVYDKGPARPTGGAGTVALWIGPHAPIVCEPGRRGSYMEHVYDFYKPNFKVEYPVVDGRLSIDCYFRALDACYAAYGKRSKTFDRNRAESQKILARLASENKVDTSKPTTPPSPPIESLRSDSPVDANSTSSEASPLQTFDYMCFHSPNCKLVAKSFSRLNFLDFKNHHEHSSLSGLRESLGSTTIADPIKDRTVESTFMKASAPLFGEKVDASLLLARSCGNMYTASLFGGLASLIASKDSVELSGKRIGLFSYRSGLASSMFSLRVVGDTNAIRRSLDLETRLAARTRTDPVHYEQCLALRETAYGKAGYEPQGDPSQLRPGTWYLKDVDDLYRRSYTIAA